MDRDKSSVIWSGHPWFEKGGEVDEAWLKILLGCVDRRFYDVVAALWRRPDESAGGLDFVRQQYERNLGGAGRRFV
jgi:hypothetical protein